MNKHALRTGRKGTVLGQFILKRANLRGQWSDDDYDLLENDVVLGHIFKVPITQ
jgi:hypothetical protein